MSSVKKISRTDLYSDEEMIDDEEEVILPKLEFDIVEVQPEEERNSVDEEQEDKEEFEFPLFSFGGGSTDVDDSSRRVDDEETRGRPLEQSNTMRVSLRSPSPEVIIQDRPSSYYFAEYTDLERSQFESVALTGDDIISQSKTTLTNSGMGKVIDLKEYNAKVERILKREARQKKIRPGKKKRLENIKSREKNEERNKIIKKQERAEKKKLMKKIHHKRGGKKNKKKSNIAAAAEATKPKYRTE